MNTGPHKGLETFPSHDRTDSRPVTVFNDRRGCAGSHPLFCWLQECRCLRRNRAKGAEREGSFQKERLLGIKVLLLS